MAEKNTINHMGILSKMPVKLENNKAVYTLLLKKKLGDNNNLNSQDITLNDYLGANIKISFLNKIYCVHCEREIKKTFNQGYCFPCFRTLAECDSCIISPEKCHYHLGTCKDPSWGQMHCMQNHYVYLANTSQLKVGITRGKNIPTRWIDQGAVSALPIFMTSKRYYAGLVEVIIKKHIKDKTNWQKMLSFNNSKLDLILIRDNLYQTIKEEIIELEKELIIRFNDEFLDTNNISDLNNDNLLNFENNQLSNKIVYLNRGEFSVLDIEYPVTAFPLKIKSFNLDKQQEISGILQGIKGQYLIFDTGVINIRNYAGYYVSVEIS